MNPDQFICELGILGKEFQGVVKELHRTKLELDIIKAQLSHISDKLYERDKSFCDLRDFLQKYSLQDRTNLHIILTVILLIAIYLK